MPTVSAVITTFNRRQYLDRAIDSVLAQTFTDFELLILDNSSSDGTDQMVGDFRDSRIRYIRHEPLSIAAARNVGLAEAKGEFIGFLDDDDEWLPKKLELQVRALQSTPRNVALVYGGFQRTDEQGRVFATHRPRLRGQILQDLLWHRDPFTGSASNALMRVDVVRALGGYDTALKTSEDWEFYVRLAEHHLVDFVTEPVVRIRRHHGPRLGDRVSDAMAVEQQVLRQYGPIMPDKLRALYLRTIGGKLCRIGQVAEGRRRILQSLRLDPTAPAAYGQLLATLLGNTGYARLHVWYKGLQRAAIASPFHSPWRSPLN